MNFLLKSLRYIGFNFNLLIQNDNPRGSLRKMRELCLRENRREIVAVEIGTFKGENAYWMLKTLPIKKLYLIDPYAKYADYEKDGSYEYINKAEKLARERLLQFRDKIVWVKEFSDKALSSIPNNVDFIYIDGNHEYDYVKKDISNFYNKVRSGGILAGHDIELPGVSRAVIEFLSKAKTNKYGILFPDWWLIKN